MSLYKNRSAVSLKLNHSKQKKLPGRSPERPKISLFGSTGQNIVNNSQIHNTITHQSTKVASEDDAKKMEYDFGTLHEFIDYDMNLKKPEDLFKFEKKSKHGDIKQSKKDQYKKFATQFKQDNDTRDCKTILKQEGDIQKVHRAAKKFIKDMVDEVYGQDINLLEERVTKKQKNKYYELMQSIKDDERTKKIMEKHFTKPLPEKIEIMEKILVKEKHRWGDSKSNDQLTESQQPNAVNTQLSLAHHHETPVQSKRDVNRKGLLLSQSSNVKSMTNVHVFDSSAITNKKSNFKSTQRQVAISNPEEECQDFELYEQQSYITAIIRSNHKLTNLFKSYKSEDEKVYNKIVQQMFQNWDETDLEDYENLDEDQQLELLHQNYFIISNSEVSAKLLIHLSMNFTSFKNLWVINLKNGLLDSSLIELMMVIMLKYCKLLRAIDLSGNYFESKCCDLLSQILSERPLKSLRISNCNITTKMFTSLCMGFALNNAISEIDASHNDIDDNGLKAFSIILKTTSTIKFLSLIQNKYGEIGKKAIYRSLTLNKKLDIKSLKLLIE